MSGSEVKYITHIFQRVFLLGYLEQSEIIMPLTIAMRSSFVLVQTLIIVTINLGSPLPRLNHREVEMINFLKTDIVGNFCINSICLSLNLLLEI
ncbi:MAG: hypothetical protein CMJ17_09665 [Phenylobacterium sp.]|nr:hypothetical protein [Phenylobacterium sp.]